MVCYYNFSIKNSSSPVIKRSLELTSFRIHFNFSKGSNKRTCFIIIRLLLSTPAGHRTLPSLQVSMSGVNHLPPGYPSTQKF